MTNYQRYRGLMQELLARREHEGGELDQSEEGARVQALDDLWRTLNEYERDALEQEYSEPAPSEPVVA